MGQHRLKLYVVPGSLNSIFKGSQSSTHSAHSNGGKVADETVLLKDLDQTNSWARLCFELQFRWFTLLLEINAVAIAWIIFARDKPYSYSTVVCFSLIVLNLVGIMASVMVLKYVLDCDRRILGVNERLTCCYQSKDPYSKPHSAVPKQAAKLLFGFAGGVLLLLLIVWAILLGTLG
jgi:hypothetical protein